VVVDPPRRPDDHVDAMVERRALALHRAPAAQGEHAGVRQRTREPPQLLGHLRGELASRAQHERPGPPAAPRDPRQQREPERRRLAGAGRGLAEDVAAVQHRRQGERLDRRHLDVAELREVIEPRGRERERRERGRRQDHAV
jgi:hypothetical protein